MGVTALITVKAVVERRELDPQDRGVEAVYGVVLGKGVGEHPTTPKGDVEDGDDPLVEAALDVLHGTIAIAVLDDFEIDVILPRSKDHAPDGVLWL